jgi:hypothetical protein
MSGKSKDKLVLVKAIKARSGVEVWLHTFLTSETEQKVVNFTPHKGTPQKQLNRRL